MKKIKCPRCQATFKPKSRRYEKHKKSCKPSEPSENFINNVNLDNLLTLYQTSSNPSFGYDSDEDITCPKCKKDWNDRLRFCPFCELPQYSIDNENIRRDIHK